MKTIISLTVLVFVFTGFSCEPQEEVQKNLPCSFELSATGRDTFNIVYNGLKQGMWIEKHDGKKDTVYYRNDTLVDK
jgi:hypothetical protein